MQSIKKEKKRFNLAKGLLAALFVVTIFVLLQSERNVELMESYMTEPHNEPRSSLHRHTLTDPNSLRQSSNSTSTLTIRFPGPFERDPTLYLQPSAKRCKPYEVNLIPNQFLCPTEQLEHHLEDKVNVFLVSQKGGSSLLHTLIRNTADARNPKNDEPVNHWHQQIPFRYLPEYMDNPRFDNLNHRFLVNENAWPAHRAKGKAQTMYAYVLILRHPYLRSVSEYYYRTANYEPESPFLRKGMEFEQFMQELGQNHVSKWIGPANSCRLGKKTYAYCSNPDDARRKQYKNEEICRRFQECDCNLARPRDELITDVKDILNHVLGLYTLVIPLERIDEGWVLAWAAGMEIPPCNPSKQTQGGANRKSKLTVDVASIQAQYKFDDERMRILRESNDLDMILYTLVTDLFELQLQVAERDPKTKKMLDLVRSGQDLPCRDYTGFVPNLGHFSSLTKENGAKELDLTKLMFSNKTYSSSLLSVIY